MQRSRVFAGPLAVLVAGSLLVLVPTPAHSAEPGYPTGTFTLMKTVGYLHEIDWEDGRWYTETFDVFASGLTDDKTAPEDLVVEKSNDAGSGFSPASFPCTTDGYECSVWYDAPGTYHPQIRVTDEDGNSTIIDLPAITILRDYTPPVVSVTKPGPRKLHRVSAWRVIRGTARDTGVGGTYRPREPDGIYGVHLKLLQKRGARWWYYTYVRNPRPGARHYQWRRGLRTEAATFTKIRGDYAVQIWAPGVVTGIRWRSPWIQGLTRGTLVVRVQASDWNTNETNWRKYSWVQLNRR